MKRYIIILMAILAVSCNSNSTKERYVVEMVGDGFSVEQVKALATDSGAEDLRLYQWSDHLAIYSTFESVESFVKQLNDKFPKMEVRLYQDPFYQFKITEHREGYTLAKEWKHILLTAALVEDKAKQQEYLEYHRTQFEEWPEVANGFCNADFQELNVYLKGRQLMLVISIPANEKFEELDPKTLENNPRVVEWNTIMGGFQEGIKGTKEGETWVFLNEI